MSLRYAGSSRTYGIVISSNFPFFILAKQDIRYILITGSAQFSWAGLIFLLFFAARLKKDHSHCSVLRNSG